MCVCVCVFVCVIVHACGRLFVYVCLVCVCVCVSATIQAPGPRPQLSRWRRAPCSLSLKSTSTIDPAPLETPGGQSRGSCYTQRCTGVATSQTIIAIISLQVCDRGRQEHTASVRNTCSSSVYGNSENIWTLE